MRVRRLSPREDDVLRLLVEGRSNAAVGVALGISVKTVQTHRARINKALGVHTPGELFALVHRQELVVSTRPTPPPQELSMSTSDPFDYRAPDPRQRTFIDAHRDAAKAMRDRLMELPPSRERSLAMTALEESLMWANKAAFAPVPPAAP